MSNQIKRAMLRRAQKAGAPSTTEQQYRAHADGVGYDVLHPTRGWKRISAKRLAAQRVIAMMSDSIAARSVRRNSTMGKLREMVRDRLAANDGKHVEAA